MGPEPRSRAITKGSMRCSGTFAGRFRRRGLSRPHLARPRSHSGRAVSCEEGARRDFAREQLLEPAEHFAGAHMPKEEVERSEEGDLPGYRNLSALTPLCSGARHGDWQGGARGISESANIAAPYKGRCAMQYRLLLLLLVPRRR